MLTGLVLVSATAYPPKGTGVGIQGTAPSARTAGQLKACYERRLKVDPTLEGRIEVQWSVGDGVVVDKPTVTANSTNDAELADCVVKRIGRWTFPADVEGEMSYPFLFQLKKG